MKKLLIATGNLNKAREIIEILAQRGIQYLTLNDFPEIKMPAETGKSFEENAVSKAKFTSRCIRLPTLADDSGLMVDYLGGAPGVYSARYAGNGCSHGDNNKKLLRALKNVPLGKRTAQFVCVMALALPGGKVITETGILRGHIVSDERGKNGFGYDPIFMPQGLDKTLAELSPEEKNRISHRFLAIQKIIPYLK